METDRTITLREFSKTVLGPFAQNLREKILADVLREIPGVDRVSVVEEHRSRFVVTIGVDRSSNGQKRVRDMVFVIENGEVSCIRDHCDVHIREIRKDVVILVPENCASYQVFCQGRKLENPQLTRLFINSEGSVPGW